MSATILVVEDERLVARDLQQTLRAMGYQVPAVAASASAAFQAAQAHRPDLALMDIHIEGEVDGVAAAASLGEIGVPVIFITAYADDDNISRAKRAEPYGYLVKPFNERELRSAIEIALHRHRLERQVRWQRRWFEATLNSIGDAVICVDREQRITFTNPVAVALAGRKAHDLLGVPYSEAFPCVDERAAASPPAPPSSIPPLRALRRPNGQLVPITESHGEILSERGEAEGTVIVLRDASDARRAQEHHADAERLRALSTLAAGVAHEVNNPLGYLSSNVQVVAQDIAELERTRVLPSPEEVADWRVALEEARDGAERVRRVVQHLKAFAGIAGGSGSSEVAKAIESALKLLGHELNRIRVTRTIEAGLPAVNAGEAQLAQLTFSLLSNAVQALSANPGREGVLEIAARRFGDRVELSVRDNGNGIPPDQLRRVFEPFFTLRPFGSGMGIGLSVCHGVVRALRGDIRLESEEGKGTTAIVMLPLATEADTPSRAPLPRGANLLRS